MGRRVRVGSALAVAALAFLVGTSPAPAAALSQAEYKCQTRIAKEVAAYFNEKLKLIQKCKNANFACPAPDSGDLQKLVDRLHSGLAKACSFGGSDAANLARMGFPGPCPDVNPGDGFTVGDLQACIQSIVDKVLDGRCGGGNNVGEACTMFSDCPDTGPGTYCRGLINVEYDSTVTVVLTETAVTCQQEVAKDTAKLSATLLKSVQTCRNALLDCKTVSNMGVDTTVCKLSGFDPRTCAINDQKTKNAIDKAKTKAIAGIEAKCSNPADVIALKLCEPDQRTPADAATCEVQTHQDLLEAFLLDTSYPLSGDVACGTTVCPVGQVCCNPLMNLCAAPGEYCVQ